MRHYISAFNDLEIAIFWASRVRSMVPSDSNKGVVHSASIDPRAPLPGYGRSISMS